MGISQQIGASSLNKPGVCTSSTRPATPYEGQMIYETDTDKVLVWDGSAWLLSPPTASPTFTGVPAAPTATAGTNTTQLATTAFANAAGGLVLITTVAVGTGVTYVDITNVFSSTYDNYRIIWGGGYGSTSAGLGIRVGGSSSNYSHVLHWSTVGGATVNLDSSASTTQCNYMGGFTTSSGSLACDINNPFISSLHTTFLEGAYIAGDMGSCRGRHNIAQSNTAVTVICLSGNITNGTISVYGYRK